MKKRILWLLTVVFIVALILSACEKEEPMAIDFNVNSYITFAQSDAINALTKFTFCQWYTPDAVNVQERTFFSSVEFGGFIFSHSEGGVSGNLRLSAYFAGSSGVWLTTDNLMSPNNKYLLCVSYDTASLANNPIFYVNGIAAAITETSTPSGEFGNGTGAFVLGYSSGYSIDGISSGVRIYNRILTPDEVMQIYSARGADNIKNGLVFCPVLYGAKGLQVFDGATLTTSNLIIDPCSGATGVPTGSPVAVGETYLIVKPH